jgi:hypothetical protein
METMTKAKLQVPHRMTSEAQSGPITENEAMKITLHDK